MKLKMLLLTIFAAGLTASLAFADSTKPHSQKADCKPVHLAGTVAPQSLTMTVTKGSDGAVVAGSQVALAVGTTGQTVRVNVEACATGTGTALQYLVKHLELQPMKAKPDKPAATTSGDGEHGDKHKGGTTTAATTTTSP